MTTTKTQVTVGADTTIVRVLSPYSYTGPVKALDKSTEARATLDGVKVARTCVTSGAGKAAKTRYYMYMYVTEAAAAKRDNENRDWIELTFDEYRAYKNDPGFTLDIARVQVAAPTEQAAAPTEAVAEQAKKGRQAKRVAA